MTARLARRLTFLTLALATVLAVGLPASTRAATGTGPTFMPSSVLTHLHVVRRETGVSTTVHWRISDGRVREQQVIDLDPVDEHVVIDQHRHFLLGNGFPRRVTDVTVTKNVATVAPDGYDLLDADVMNYAWPTIARVRAGAAKLTFGGRGLLKASYRLGANECAGLKAGTRTIFLDAATLVPVRVTDRRGGVVDRDLRFARRGGRASDFAKLTVAGRRQLMVDEGFTRRTAAAAAAKLDVPISVPSALPDGFKLAYSGSASAGRAIGPEASFPRSKGVFFAKWRRGLESIDFTIRGATSTLARDWDESDPFGAECETTLSTSTETVGTSTAHYAVGEDRAPRLWWRSGTTLYTLSGPFAADQLVAIAASLRSVPG